jgi:glycosyltransferase involved in cell wall biosynthesis
MTKRIIILTSTFPVSKEETFFINELKFIKQKYDEILIFPVNATVNFGPPIKDVIHGNVQLSRIEKILTFRFLFKIDVLRELTYSWSFKKNRFKILKTLLVSFARSIKIRNILIRSVEIREDDLFYSFWGDDGAIALSLLKKKFKTVKMISRFHGWDLYHEASDIGYIPFRNLISKRLDLLIPISEFGKEYIVKNWRSEESNIMVSRLGVTGRKYSERKFEDFTIVSVSSLIPLKRVEQIMLALSQIQFEKIQWFHFGDGELLKNLKIQSQQKLSKNIQTHFMGYVTNEGLMNWYGQNQPAVFINVSTSEGIPVSIMEAMSFGIPVIATQVGGTSEIVNTKNGLLLNADFKSDELKDAILNFYNLSEEENQTFSKAAKEKWDKEFNSEKNYLDFLKNIQSL